MNFETNQRNSKSFQLNHFIESNSNSMTTKKIRFQTIQIKSIKITSMQSNEMISAKLIRKKKFQINKMHRTIHFALSHQIRNRSNAIEKNQKIFAKINFVIDSDFCFFMNHANKSIDNHFNQLIDDSDCFLIEKLFHSFQFIDLKQKKISDFLKKFFSNLSTNAMCYQIFVFSTHVL